MPVPASSSSSTSSLSVWSPWPGLRPRSRPGEPVQKDFKEMSLHRLCMFKETGDYLDRWMWCKEVFDIKKVNFLISKVSLSFNFMSLVPMMRITGTGVDLFTMQSARVWQKSISIKEIVPTFYVFLSLHKHVIVCIIVIGGPSAE